MVDRSDSMYAGKFGCPECAQMFKYKCDLFYHRRLHTGAKNLLAAHMRIHTGERPFKCEHCPEAFIDRSRKLRHLNRVHLGLKPYACRQCDHRELLRHRMVMHLVKTHQVDVATDPELQKWAKCSKLNRRTKDYRRNEVNTKENHVGSQVHSDSPSMMLEVEEEDSSKRI
ncbi:hypothetical protein AAVH_35842 [Aphelenchoides avenae]|nr:hypothetical protein AAVH_35842 [Aphelenchus avenae]